jgi:hypothetical protein
MREDHFWRSYAGPVALSVAIFSGCNYLWLHPVLGTSLNGLLHYALAVYLLAGSGLALVLLYRALRVGRLGQRDLGLEISGWTAPRRLLALVLVVTLSFGSCVLLQSELPKRTDLAKIWSDYCYWFVILLPASLAELLVFLGMGFCLLGRGLRQWGLGRIMAGAVALAVASVGFGLFHYTYEPRFHPYAFPLMGEMLLVGITFLLTRNLYVALAVHNAFAATGFMREEYSGEPYDTAGIAYPQVLAAFIIPFLVLHWMEWRRTGPDPDKAAGKSIPKDARADTASDQVPPRPATTQAASRSAGGRRTGSPGKAGD